MRKQTASLILGSGNFKGAMTAYSEERIAELHDLLENESDILKLKQLQGGILELRRLIKAADTAMAIWKNEERKNGAGTT